MQIQIDHRPFFTAGVTGMPDSWREHILSEEVALVGTGPTDGDHSTAGLLPI
jgi:hypothetical protein